MATNDDVTRKEQAFSAAARRFPQAELAIRRLMGRSEDFCDLCADLADAERALAGVRDKTVAQWEERKREWQELVDHIVSEVAEALGKSEGRGPGSKG
ncbi:hypothetical protein C9413_13820 [Rhizobium sp. SEMIA 4085]|uniref:Uncharacterized protein n=1 Tax=Rhizobium gallicum bv. gallicum R602sp TaxID=1041138 RepID=A0A0B4X333_9HYPH|nr:MULTISPECIES: hypothetical protein [Rhizobium]AJD42524.1 hypothetical protein RGR602_CH03208 [Rhizobium gallicum bv. gallicum R602sp]NNH30544.1 hypothetical protein [Rhizobium sp. SEMIA 4085]